MQHILALAGTGLDNHTSLKAKPDILHVTAGKEARVAEEDCPVRAVFFGRRKDLAIRKILC
jgi:hypothetical protein